ncbi:MAG: tetratricopeptide repeat protein, partial [Candidatus Lokiarchaeota archaeon]|nr:tetratricopeptide repeat protein [Candidatus Lokiarchaeota archaeon]
MSDDYEMWFNEAFDKGERGDYRGAIELYEKVVEAKPDYQAAWFNLGLMWSNLYEYDKSIEYYKK